MHALAVGQGWRIAKKTVLALMRQEGLYCRVRRRKRYSSWKGQLGRIARNHLDRQFNPPRPNTAWVTDVTEFHIGQRKIYLSPVIDLYDRSGIAHSWSYSPTTAFTNSSLKDAIDTLPNGDYPMVHSDQGLHYQHWSWQKMLTNARLKQSMSRKANCLDNAVAENFFSHLKTEMFHHHTYTNVEEFTTELNAYIHRYNTERISLQRKGLSPAQYRAQALTN